MRKAVVNLVQRIPDRVIERVLVHKWAKNKYTLLYRNFRCAVSASPRRCVKKKAGPGINRRHIRFDAAARRSGGGGYAEKVGMKTKRRYLCYLFTSEILHAI